MSDKKKTPAEKAAETRERKKAEAEAQRIIDNHTRSLRDLREGWLNEPPPHRIRAVGDRVQVGNIKESVITAVLDGGKIYEVHQIVTNTNYGRPFDSERDSYIRWTDADNLEPEGGWPEPIAAEDDVRFRVSSTSISGFLGQCYGHHAGIDDDADYQRGNVWELEQKVALLDSIFNNIEIGKVALIYREYAPGVKGYEVLDGKQRLNALVEFYEDRFRFRGLLYSEMHPHDRNHFENTTLVVATATEGMTDEQKYRYFLKLNVSGVPQDPAHIEAVRKMHAEASK